MRHKIIVYGNKIYKEIVLDRSLKTLSIGTTKECQLRFKHTGFLDDFRLDIEQREGIASNESTFVLLSNRNITFSTNDICGEKVHALEIGDHLSICYEDTNVPFLYIDYIFDYKRVQDDYNLRIQVPSTGQFLIGALPGCSILINDPIVRNGYVIAEAIKKDNGDTAFDIDTTNAKYSVCINGFLVRNDEAYLNKGDFISFFGYVFYFDGSVWYTSDNELISSDFACDHIYQSTNKFKYPEFVKNSRQRYRLPDKKIEVLPPGNLREQSTGQMIMNLLPMMVSMAVMMGMRGFISGSFRSVILYSALIVGSIAATIIRICMGKKRYKKQMIDRIVKYEKYMDRKEEEIQQLRNIEKYVIEKTNPSLIQSLEDVKNFSSTLFEKSIYQDDYLDIWIGTGEVKSLFQVDYKKKESIDFGDDLMQYPEQLAEKYQFIQDMPIVLRLNNNNAIGICGDRKELYYMAQNMIITLASQHFYKNVKLCLIMNVDDSKKFAWARWLQNFSDDLKDRLFIYDDDSKKVGFQYLYNILTEREKEKKSDIIYDMHYVIFVYRSEQLEGHPITDYVQNANSLGFTFIFFEEYEEMLHYAINQKIYLEHNSNKGTIQNVDDGVEVQKFQYPIIDSTHIAQAALRLAPIYVEEKNIENALPKNISLFSLLGIMSAYDLNLKHRWKESDVSKSLIAPIGVLASGEVLGLDIHEKAHGPHGLVAGTTGSGKSELLQTFILSLATLYHPYEVSFVIIDFKGGGMANQFRELPHLNGAITNIDGKQIDRSLKSIKAELLKRQRLFAEYDVNKIDDYIKLWKMGEAKIPLPHLILIVDEFAELKTDQPEFMKELISTARIGRSLGVHLILATQKPAGVVNDQIWSNSKFKLCLKVQDEADSKGVLKSPLAASIKEPGRAYLQVGNNEIFELFQSAYSGAPALVIGVDEDKEFEINKIDLAGRKTQIYCQKKNEQSNTETQMDAIVHYINEYCEESGIKKIPEICLPPLEEIINYEQACIDNNETDIIVPLGIYDDPDHQVQQNVSLNITKNNTFIVGTALQGKTNLIQTLIRGITDSYTPQDVNIYIIDFASMILKNFEDLCFVGGVVTDSEDNKLKQLVKLLIEEIDKRKKDLSEKGLSSFSAYREAGYKDYPQIVLMIENYTALRELYAEQVEELTSVFRDGLSVGISVIVTNTVTNGSGLRFLSNFAQRISLYCNDSSTYGVLFDHCKLLPDQVAGRGIIKIDDEIREVQTYLAFSGEKEVEKVEKMRSFVLNVNRRYEGMYARKIPAIPEQVTERYLKEQFGKAILGQSALLPLGMIYETVEPAMFDLFESSLLGVFGNDKIGRLQYIRNLIRLLDSRSSFDPAKIYIIDDVNRELQECAEFKAVADYTINASSAGTIIKETFEEAKLRYNKMSEDINYIDGVPRIVIIFNSRLSADMLSADANVVSMYNTMASKMKNCKLLLIQSNMDNTPVTFKTSAIIKTHVDDGIVIGFESIKMIKMVIPPNSVIRKYSSNMTYADAFYMRAGGFTKLKMLMD
ncbi:MAG: type VII secretion protein EssC [Butyrivibrio sp.]|nr:type VII secretion protein EssC [Butyrivibrio sp.]